MNLEQFMLLGGIFSVASNLQVTIVSRMGARALDWSTRVLALKLASLLIGRNTRYEQGAIWRKRISEQGQAAQDANCWRESF